MRTAASIILAIVLFVEQIGPLAFDIERPSHQLDQVETTPEPPIEAAPPGSPVPPADEVPPLSRGSELPNGPQSELDVLYPMSSEANTPLYSGKSPREIPSGLDKIAAKSAAESEGMPVSQAGAQLEAFGGSLQVYFPPDALSTPLSVQIKRPDIESLPYTLSGSPFEIIARNTSKAEVEQFKAPLVISISYDPEQFKNYIDDLHLYYFDEDEKTWHPLPTKVDKKASRLYAWTDHLTIFDFGALSNSQQILPNLDIAGGLGYTGAVGFTLPFEFPQGPGGFTPQLSITYNSSIVDEALIPHDASIVGMGWSFDIPHIERNDHGSSYIHDDTYVLYIDGGAYTLLRDGLGNWRTMVETHYRVDNYGWGFRVTNKAGYQYIFTPVTYSYQFVVQGSCDLYRIDYNFPVTEIISPLGKRLTIAYSTHYKNTRYECDEYTTLSNAIATYPVSITYDTNDPNVAGSTDRVQISFAYEPRTDTDPDWFNYIGSSRQAYQNRLKEIRVQVDVNGNGVFESNEISKSYVFSYAPDDATNIFPAYVWKAGGKTLTLTQIQEKGSDDNLLPLYSFIYGDGQHLTEISNGYGGKVNYTYEPWYDDHTTGRSRLDNISTRDCADPALNTWAAGGTAYALWCDKSRFHLLSTTTGYIYSYDNIYKPGAYYKVEAHAYPNALVGFNTPNWEEFSATTPVYIYMPLDATLPMLRMVHCQTDCMIEWFYEYLMPTYYRVTQKTVSDQTTGQSFDFTYSYDDPMTNDDTNSEDTASSVPYIPWYGEFRGHSMVREQGPDGRISTNWYYQDDARKGLSYLNLITDSLFFDQFEQLDAAQWSTTIGTQEIERVTGDSALKLASSGVLQRPSETLTDGEAAYFYWRAPSTTVGGQAVKTADSVLALTSGADALGIHLTPSNGIWVQRNGVDQGQLVTPDRYRADAWYILMFQLAEGELNIRMWEQGLPCWERTAAGECLGTSLNDFSWSYTAGVQSEATWRFSLNHSAGTLYVDDYNEATLYSMQENYYQDSVNWSVARPSNGYYGYTSPSIRWTRLVDSRMAQYGATGQAQRRRAVYEYDPAMQGGAQYGNVTGVIESIWQDGAWVSYYKTNTSYTINLTNYIVNLPASVQRYVCPGGACTPVNEHLLSSQINLYDGATSPGAAPSQGLLTAQRSLLRFAGDNYSDPRYQDVRYNYDAWGNPTSVRQYTGEGTSASLAGEGERVTSMAYDSATRTHVVSQTNALNQTTTWQYNLLAGLPDQETDPNQAVTTAAYDAHGRIISIVQPGDSPGSPTTVISYTDAAPFMVQTINKIDDTTQAISRKIYDGQGRLIQEQQGGARVNGQSQDVIADYTYDGYGRLVSQSVPYAVTSGSGYRTPDSGQAASANQYDLLGRLVSTQAPNGALTGTIYTIQNQQQVVTITDALQHQTVRRLDIFGRLVEVIPSNGPGVTYTYDFANRMTDALYGSAATHIEYDVAGRKLAMQDADMGSWSYQYNALGALTSQTDARGCVIGLSYDALDRLTGKTYSGPGACDTTPDVSYYYDGASFSFLGAPLGGGTYPAGRRTGMLDGSGATTWSYDARGRMVAQSKYIFSNAESTQAEGFTTTWTYNSADLPVNQTYPDGEVVTTHYDSRGAPVSLVNEQAPYTYVKDVMYDEAGRKTDLDLGSADEAAVLSSSFAYYAWDEPEVGGRLSGLTTANQASDVLQQLTYDYDANGNVLSIADTLYEETSVFSYDSLERLTSMTVNDALSAVVHSEVFAYDPLTGNMAGKGSDAGSLETYSYAVDHPHAVSSYGSNTYTYDANGNQTGRVLDWQALDLTYDAENHLITVVNQNPEPPT
ncbi:MAG: hypothetical protein VB089_10790, partial [Anaerolineaceae bacterium]|nr:hypothetical protein [Anaerolineaceae bacterium]